MPESAVADVTAGFDLSSEISATLDAPAPASEPAAPAAEAAPVVDTPAAIPGAEPGSKPAAEAEPVKAETPEIPEVPEPELIPAAKLQGDLPEGITVRELKDGQKEYIIDQQHARTILNGYHAAQAVEEVIGQPLTKEFAEQMYSDHIVRGRMDSDLIIGGNEGAQRILAYLNGSARNAITNGETRVDGMTQLASEMPAFFARNNPEAFNAQYNAYTRHALDGLYQIAADSNDANLRNAVAWVDHKIFGNHRKADATPKTDPLAMREARIREAEQRLHGTNQQAAQQQWRADAEAHGAEVKTRAEGVINELTKPLAAFYKEYPTQLTSIKNQIDKILKDSVGKDQNWNQQRNDLLRRAQQAASPALRKELLNTVANLTEQRARTILNPARNADVRAIINDAARLAKAKNEADLARAQKASEKRQPGPGGAAPDRSVLPATPEKTGLLSRDDIAAEIGQFMSM